MHLTMLAVTVTVMSLSPSAKPRAKKKQLQLNPCKQKARPKTLQDLCARQVKKLRLDPLWPKPPLCWSPCLHLFLLKIYPPMIPTISHVNILYHILYHVLCHVWFNLWLLSLFPPLLPLLLLCLSFFHPSPIMTKQVLRLSHHLAVHLNVKWMSIPLSLRLFPLRLLLSSFKISMAGCYLMSWL
jgi:hypothetical protein